MVVRLEVSRGDLHPAANAEMESLRQRKAAQPESRRQKHFLLSVQRTARPERRILFEHGPDLSLDLVIDRGIEDDRPAQEIRSSGWKIRTDCALNIPRPDALGGSESWRQDGGAQPSPGSGRREGNSPQESPKIV